MPTPHEMRSALRRSLRVLVKELSAFGVVGAGCFVLDLGLFQWLYVNAGMDAVLAKLVSTLVSMTVAYVGHRHWSFSHRARTGIRREYSIFFAVNGLTMALGLGIMGIAHHVLGLDDPLVLLAVNVGSIGVGTVIRFVAYRRWVFVAEGTPVAVAHGESLARRRETRAKKRVAA